MFRAIIDAFLKQEDLNPAAVELGGDADGEVQHYFADTDLRERFRTFHNQRACLRVVAKEANLAMGRPKTGNGKDAA